MDSLKLKKIVADLTALGEEEAIEAFRLLFEQWQDAEIDEPAGWKCETKYFVGTAERSVRETGDWDEWEIAAVAYPDKTEYPNLGPNWGFCQEATCQSCGISLVSNCKRAFCSICGARVSLT